jgi:hypothetical protein
MTSNTIPDPEGSIVRVWDETGKAVVGVGFLVPDGRVVTCAHVIVQALKLPVNIAILPTDVVPLDFPRIAPSRFVPARVLGGHVGIDVALLELIEEAPDGVRPLRFAEVEDVRELAFEAFGCPYASAPAAGFSFLGLGSAPKREQYQGGVWAWGQLRRRQGNNYPAMRSGRAHHVSRPGRIQRRPRLGSAPAGRRRPRRPLRRHRHWPGVGLLRPDGRAQDEQPNHTAAQQQEKQPENHRGLQLRGVDCGAERVIPLTPCAFSSTPNEVPTRIFHVLARSSQVGPA